MAQGGIPRESRRSSSLEPIQVRRGRRGSKVGPTREAGESLDRDKGAFSLSEKVLELNPQLVTLSIEVFADLEVEVISKPL